MQAVDSDAGRRKQLTKQFIWIPGGETQLNQAFNLETNWRNPDKPNIRFGYQFEKKTLSQTVHLDTAVREIPTQTKHLLWIPIGEILLKAIDLDTSPRKPL